MLLYDIPHRESKEQTSLLLLLWLFVLFVPIYIFSVPEQSPKQSFGIISYL